MGPATHCSLLFLSFVGGGKAVRQLKKTSNWPTVHHYPCEFKTCISTGRASRCLGEFQDCEQEFQEDWCPDIERAVNTTGHVYGWDSDLTLIITEAYGMCSEEEYDLEALWNKYEDYVDGNGPCTFSSCLATADLEACQNQSHTCIDFAQKLEGVGMSDAVDIHEQIDVAAAALRMHSGDEAIKVILDVLEKTDRALFEKTDVAHRMMQELKERRMWPGSAGRPEKGVSSPRSKRNAEKEDEKDEKKEDDEKDADDAKEEEKAPVADDEKDEKEEDTAQPRSKPTSKWGIAKKFIASKWGQAAKRFKGGAP